MEFVRSRVLHSWCGRVFLLDAPRRMGSGWRGRAGAGDGRRAVEHCGCGRGGRQKVVNGISGAPVSRALVQLGARAMLADGEGRFRFEQAGQPPSVIRATKPGYSVSPEQFDGGSAATSGNGDPLAVVVTLWPEALLTGTVLAPDGEPLPHIAVQARRSVFDEQGHRFQQAGQSQTDSHGEFRIPVTAGDYVVESQFSQRGFERDEAVLPAAYPPALSGGTAGTVHLLPGQEAHLELRPGVSRTHVVTLPFDSDSDGGPPPRITVRSSTGSDVSGERISIAGGGGGAP